MLYLVYLFILTNTPGIPLAVFWTSEQVYVTVLFVLSLLYLQKGKWENKRILK